MVACSICLVRPYHCARSLLTAVQLDKASAWQCTATILHYQHRPEGPKGFFSEGDTIKLSLEADFFAFALAPRDARSTGAHHASEARLSTTASSWYIVCIHTSAHCVPRGGRPITLTGHSIT